MFSRIRARGLSDASPRLASATRPHCREKQARKAKRTRRPGDFSFPAFTRRHNGTPVFHADTCAAQSVRASRLNNGVRAPAARLGETSGRGGVT
jgi:hypothetical protein